MVSQSICGRGEGKVIVYIIWILGAVAEPKDIKFIPNKRLTFSTLKLHVFTTLLRKNPPPLLNKCDDHAEVLWRVVFIVSLSVW